MSQSIAAKEWKPSEKLPEDFLNLPHKLYAQDPNWIPEDRDALEASFSESNPYFSKNKACIIHSENLRLAGFYNPELRIDGETAAFFGFWETTNDLDLCKDAFDQLDAWARGLGAKRIYGPINFSTYNDYRLRLDAFERPQFLGEPYNPSYYPDLLEQLGYEIRYKYFTACCTTQVLAFAAKMQIEKLEKKANDAGITLKPLTSDYWMASLDQLYPIVDCIFKENFAYTPITFDQFKSYCGEKFANKFCPTMSNVALQNDKIVAFQLFYPDYSPLVTQAAENRIDTQNLRYCDHFQLLPEPRTFLGKTVGVHPDFRSMGLGYYGGFFGTLRAEEHKLYEFGYGAMVREDNHSKAIKKFAQHSYHYGLFHKAL
ncbi:MAG: hypothetical protein MI867_15565 [Pseudomonadales bacterium]|nr:hypothetical protein [Pseudomonadales bacterium]